MPVTLLNTLIIPVQALAWLGRQGTRAIAALVFIGIVVPPIGNVLKPFVTEAIFLLLCISFMRVDIRRCMTTCAGRESSWRRQGGRTSGCL